MNEVPEFYQFLMSMGVGGVLAGMTIWLLNRAWKEHAETIKGFHEIEKGRADMLVSVINKNTEQTAVNTSVLYSLHRRLDKDTADKDRGL